MAIFDVVCPWCNNEFCHGYFVKAKDATDAVNKADRYLYDGSFSKDVRIKKVGSPPA